MANLLNDAEKHELMQERLRAIPVAMVERRLDERLSAGAQQLLDSIVLEGQSGYSRKKAKYTFALLAQAKHGLHSEELEINGPFSLPAWLKTARAELDQFIEGDPEEREILWFTDFYSSGLPIINNLERGSSGAVVPFGPYDNQTFAAGMATGTLTVEPPEYR